MVACVRRIKLAVQKDEEETWSFELAHYKLGSRGGNIWRAARALSKQTGGGNATLTEIERALRGLRHGEENVPHISAQALREGIYQQTHFSTQGDKGRYRVRKATDAEVRYILRRVEQIREVENRCRKDNNVRICDLECLVLLGADCATGNGRQRNKMGHFQVGHKRVLDCFQGWRSCVQVNEAFSSQRCYRCLGKLKYATKREIRSKQCTSCAKYVDRDKNASLCFVYNFIYGLLHHGASHPLFQQKWARKASDSFSHTPGVW